MANDRSDPPFWLIALIVWLAGGIFSLTPWAERLEWLLQDRYAAGLSERLPSDERVVVLDIDEATLAALAPEYGRYPWSRAVYGQLLEGLTRQRPQAVVFDIIFSDPHRDHRADDLYFIRAAQGLGKVYFPFVHLGEPKAGPAERGFPLARLPGARRSDGADENATAPLLLPMPGLAAAGRLGAINIEPDADGVLRRYPIHLAVAGWYLPSLAARVAADAGVGLPAGDTWTLAWYGPPRSIHTIPFHEVYFDLQKRRPRRPAGEFRERIIVIGASAPALSDLKHTPLATKFPGPEVIATAVANLLRGERLVILPRAAGYALLTVLLLAAAYAFGRGAGVPTIAAGALAASVIIFVGAWAAALGLRVVLPVGGALLIAWVYVAAAGLMGYWREHRRRERITHLFARFLDPRVVARLIAGDGAEEAAAGEKREITVLFSDIRGFTALAEGMAPQELLALLNDYYRRQTAVIFRHEGTLDKYIGDAIMAFWGAPATQPDHADRALRAAREMAETLAEFKRELGARADGFDIGVGIHSGEAVVGFVGSAQHRQDYTVIGDTVNTASRIEGETRGRARVLVSEMTKQACKDKIDFIDHGEVKLKGRTRHVRLFEPRWKQ